MKYYKVYYSEESEENENLENSGQETDKKTLVQENNNENSEKDNSVSQVVSYDDSNLLEKLDLNNQLVSGQLFMFGAILGAICGLIIWKGIWRSVK